MSDTANLSTNSDPVTRSLDAVRSIVRALRVNTRAIERQIGMSLAQLFVLQELAKREADSLGDLAERTATHQTSVSVVVKRLAERGLLTRVPAHLDRRKVEIAITDSGKEIVGRAPETISSRLLAGLEAMKAEDRARLADLMERWLHFAHIDLATPPMFLEDEPPG
jgi:DNA-binding MarR family transcriptional regulator